jgi:hypothetical protein
VLLVRKEAVLVALQVFSDQAAFDKRVLGTVVANNNVDILNRDVKRDNTTQI